MMRWVPYTLAVTHTLAMTRWVPYTLSMTRPFHLPQSTRTVVPPMASYLKKRAKEVFISEPFELAVSSVNPKYRHEIYQKPEEVVVTIFAKGIPAKDVNVEFGEQILSVSIDVAGEDTYYFQPRLFGKIIPEKCRFDVLSTKVEIRLAKAEPLHWTSLEFGKDSFVPLRVSGPVVGASSPDYPSLKRERVDRAMRPAEERRAAAKKYRRRPKRKQDMLREVQQDSALDTLEGSGKQKG